MLVFFIISPGFHQIYPKSKQINFRRNARFCSQHAVEQQQLEEAGGWDNDDPDCCWKPGDF